MAAAEWTPTRRSDSFDLAVAVVFAVATGISLHVGSDPAISGRFADYSRPAGIAAVALLSLALVPRRRGRGGRRRRPPPS